MAKISTKTSVRKRRLRMLAKVVLLLAIHIAALLAVMAVGTRAFYSESAFQRSVEVRNKHDGYLADWDMDVDHIITVWSFSKQYQYPAAVIDLSQYAHKDGSCNSHYVQLNFTSEDLEQLEHLLILNPGGYPITLINYGNGDTLLYTDNPVWLDGGVEWLPQEDFWAEQAAFEQAYASPLQSLLHDPEYVIDVLTYSYLPGIIIAILAVSGITLLIRKGKIRKAGFFYDKGLQPEETPFLVNLGMAVAIAGASLAVIIDGIAENMDIGVLTYVGYAAIVIAAIGALFLLTVLVISFARADSFVIGWFQMIWRLVRVLCICAICAGIDYFIYEYLSMHAWVGRLLIFIVAIQPFWFLLRAGGGGDEKEAHTSGKGAVSMPDIIYDRDNRPLQKLYDNGTDAWYRDEGGKEIILRDPRVSGSRAETNEGWFHWHDD